MSLQPLEDLEEFYNLDDPWGYETNPDDEERKTILLNELSRLGEFNDILDIGCGHGFITRDLVANNEVVGVDISEKAIKQAKKISSNSKTRYISANMFDLSTATLKSSKKFDLIIITGVLYPQYIGSAHNIIYTIIDDLLADGGFLVSVHIKEWYRSRFPYPELKNFSYKYRDYQHYLEVYKKV